MEIRLGESIRNFRREAGKAMPELERPVDIAVFLKHRHGRSC